MVNDSIIWLASYPRSGNTFVRTILWQCFGLRSASFYPDDFTQENSQLREFIGHIEHGPDKIIRFPANGIPLVKTHEYPRDKNPAIYIVRDGRAAAVSLWKFYGGTISLETIIEGQFKFGVWSSHVQAWAPFERMNTLMLKYEDMETDLSGTLKKISNFLQREILAHSMPNRDVIASTEGRWVKKKSDWRSDISDELLRRFNELNGVMLKKLGYL